MNYRKIWEQTNGPIPKDEQGKSYDIHHIDGNKKNNSIENLKCVTIREHYDIHYNQGDWGAAYLIACRLNKSLEEMRELAILAGKSNRGKTRTEETREKIREYRLGKKHDAKTIEKMSQAAKARKSNRKGVPLSKEHKAKIGKASKGRNHTLETRRKISEIRKGLKKELVECPHCKKVGGANAMVRYHFNNCKNSGKLLFIKKE